MNRAAEWSSLPFVISVYIGWQRRYTDWFDEPSWWPHSDVEWTPCEDAATKISMRKRIAMDRWSNRRIHFAIANERELASFELV